MRGTRDADGSTLLDNSMLMYGAGLGDGNLHSLWNISAAVLGGGRGSIKGGRHIIFEPGTPLSNLHVAMLNKAGIPTESFGGKYGMSSGELDLSRPA